MLRNLPLLVALLCGVALLCAPRPGCGAAGEESFLTLRLSLVETISTSRQVEWKVVPHTRSAEDFAAATISDRTNSGETRSVTLRFPPIGGQEELQLHHLVCEERQQTRTIPKDGGQHSSVLVGRCFFIGEVNGSEVEEEPYFSYRVVPFKESSQDGALTVSVNHELQSRTQGTVNVYHAASSSRLRLYNVVATEAKRGADHGLTELYQLDLHFTREEPMQTPLALQHLLQFPHHLRLTGRVEAHPNAWKKLRFKAAKAQRNSVAQRWVHPALLLLGVFALLHVLSWLAKRSSTAKAKTPTTDVPKRRVAAAPSAHPHDE